MSPFGQLLLTTREALNLSIRQAAHRCRISHGHWNNLEKSKREPTREVVIKIVTGLEIPEDKRDDFHRFIDAPPKTQNLLTREDIISIEQLHPSQNMAQSVEDDLRDFVECWQAYVRAKYEQYNRNWEQTIALTEDAHQRIQRLSQRVSAYLLDTKAAAQLHLNQQEAVTATYEQIEGALSTVTDPFIRAYNRQHRGDYFREYNQWQQAKACYHDARDLFTRMKEYNNEVARCDRKLASMYLHEGDWHRAEPLLETSLKTFEARGNLHEQIKTRFVLGYCYNLSGRWTEAEAEHQRGFDLAKEKHKMRDGRPDPYLIMLAHSYLATDARQRRDWKKAQEDYMAAKVCSCELGYKREDSWIELGLARLHHQRGRMYALNHWSDETDQYFGQAAKHFRASEEHSKSAGSDHQYAMTLVHYSRLLLDQRKFEEASLKLTEAQRLTTRLGSAYYEAAAMTLQCEIYRRWDKVERVAQFANRIVSLHNRFNFHNHMAALRMTEARALLAIGATPTSDSIMHASTDIARAFYHALRFNDFYVQDLMATFGQTLSPNVKQPYARSVREQLRNNVAEKLADVLAQSRADRHVLEERQEGEPAESYLKPYEKAFADRLEALIDTIQECPITGDPYLPPELRIDIDSEPTR